MPLSPLSNSNSLILIFCDSLRSSQVVLTYECEGERGRAKWDKSKKELVVTVPVKKPSEKEMKEMEEKHKLVKTVAETVEDLENLKVRIAIMIYIYIANYN